MMRDRLPPLRVVGSPQAPRLAQAEADLQELELGDVDALYRRFAPYVAAVATRLLGRSDEVDDLIQDVFLQALRGIGGLRDPLAVKAWLSKVTVRLAVRRLRRRRWIEALVPLSAHVDYDDLAAPQASPEQRALLAKIYTLLDSLPARTRVIWALRHVLGESLQGIVALTGSSRSTVQRKLREAECLLEKELTHA
jgi:RNA polymerase sigma-70 factor (ECF subfamily)